jgi:hypothetical protein
VHTTCIASQRELNGTFTFTRRSLYAALVQTDMLNVGYCWEGARAIHVCEPAGTRTVRPSA